MKRLAALSLMALSLGGCAALTRIRNGMEVALGGGAINDTDGAAYTQVDWVARPAARCDTPTRFHVSSVVLP